MDTSYRTDDRFYGARVFRGLKVSLAGVALAGAMLAGGPFARERANERSNERWDERRAAPIYGPRGYGPRGGGRRSDGGG